MTWVQRRVSSQKNAKCERCGNLTDLRKSHAIPDAFFRQMKRDGLGKITRIHQGDGLRPTSESGWSYILCDECEQHFNRVCDERVVLFANEIRRDGMAELDHSIIAMFICSVLWRAQLSSAGMYSGYRITERDAENLAEVVLSGVEPFLKFSYEVALVCDDFGQINSRKLKATISSPYRAETTIGSVNHVVHHFICAGVFFAAIYPRIPFVVADSRYLSKGEFRTPSKMRALSSLSNFRNIETLARIEAGWREP